MSIERTPAPECIPEQLQERRLLTEVNHLLVHRRVDGTYPEEVVAGVRTNLFTAVQEISMPYAVTKTFQQVAEQNDQETLQKQRTFMWLGRTALEVAESGRLFHFSDAALRRVEIEIEEAKHSQAAMRPGIAQVFISPRMTETDAPLEVARREHLADDDAVRVSWLACSEDGKVIGRYMQSLLVRDVPLAAWVAMLRDENNMFGRAFDIRDESSAESVMELFQQLELPLERLPEGPVSILREVAKYVHDAEERRELYRQIGKFRENQQTLHTEAELAADKWLAFETELADSLANGHATYEIRRFIHTLHSQWNENAREVLQRHHVGNSEFAMTRELAAIVEKAHQNILNAEVSIVTNNEKVLAQLNTQEAEAMRRDIEFMRIAEHNGASMADVMRMQANMQRNIAGRNLKVGGGCAGSNVGEFGNGLGDGPEGADAAQDKSGDRKTWKTKKGRCVVESCPTRPGEVKVGPCGVCMDRCQRIYDSGGDPTKQKRVVPPKPVPAPKRMKQKQVERSHDFALAG